MAALGQTAFSAIRSVQWPSGGYVVVDVTRSRNVHGQTVPGAPFIYFHDQYFDFANRERLIHINWDEMIDPFPENDGEGHDLVVTNPPNQLQKREMVRWGSNPVIDVGGGGEVGAASTDYQDGDTVRNLEFFNVLNAKARLPSPPEPHSDFSFRVQLEELIGYDPGGATDRIVYYAWPSQIPPLVGIPSGAISDGLPVFSIEAAGGDTSRPPYYIALNERYAVWVDSLGNPVHDPYVATGTSIASYEWGLTGLGEAPPYTTQFGQTGLFTSPDQPAAFCSWANSYFQDNGGFGFNVQSGLIPAGDNPVPEQPTQDVTLRFMYFAGQPNFTFTDDNTPTWSAVPKQTITFHVSGSAPMPAHDFLVTFTKKDGLTVTDSAAIP